MAKYAVGDVLRCTYDKYGKIKKDQIVTVDEVRPNKEGYKFKEIINLGYWYVGEFFEPVEADVVRLRVLEGIGVLRKGSIVTVKKEHATTFLLNEHPGKLYKKERFERIGAKAAEAKAEDAITNNEPIRVGDKVYVIKKEGDNWVPDMDNSVNDGVAYEVLEVLQAVHGKVIRIKTPINRWYLESCLSKVAPIPAPRPLKVGDKVIAVSTEVSFKKHGPSEHMVAAVKNKVVLTVQCLNRKSIGHVQMETDGANDLWWNSNWDISDLVFADGSPIEGGAPVKGATKAPNKPIEPPKKKELPDIYKELNKASGDSLNDWIVLHKDKEEYTKYFNAPCFAQFNYMKGPIERLVVSLKNARNGYKVSSNNQEAFEQYVDYIYNRSPWADCFINKKDIKQVLDEGYELNPEFGISRLVGAAIAIRDGYEYQSRLVVFKHFVEEGFSEDVAHLLAFCLTSNNGDGFTISGMSNGHTIFDGGFVAEEIFKFYREGYFLDVALNESPIKDGIKGNYLVSKAIASWNGKSMYQADSTDPSSLKTFITNNVEKTVKGAGFNRVELVSIEAANKLAAIIQKKLEK